MIVLDRRFSGNLSRNIDDYPEGLVVVIDKPYRWTSADVVRKVKYAAIRHFGKRNLKVGHAGTLDPLATGVLIMCIGNACKKAENLQASDKEYVADVCFGATTPSYDREKDVDATFPTDGVTCDSLPAVLQSFLGWQEQVAPLFSAKQVDGVRAYELARKLHSQGLATDDAARSLLRVGKINITGLECLDFFHSPDGCNSAVSADGSVEGRSCSANSNDPSSRINIAEVPAGLPVARIRIACSKGTYIRAFARDLGERMGSGAFLYALQRSRSGTFLVENAATVNQVLDFLA